jgi:hypothetical protein
MNINDLLSSDFIHNELRDFGEWITYIPYQQAPVEIMALINRQPPSAILGLTGASSYKPQIMIARDCRHGIVLVNNGKDQAVLNAIVGGPVKAYTVQEIIHSDQGVWVLELS